MTQSVRAGGGKRGLRDWTRRGMEGGAAEVRQPGEEELALLSGR